jgi:hypothetical protein
MTEDDYVRLGQEWRHSHELMRSWAEDWPDWSPELARLMREAVDGSSRLDAEILALGNDLRESGRKSVISLIVRGMEMPLPASGATGVKHASGSSAITGAGALAVTGHPGEVAVTADVGALVTRATQEGIAGFRPSELLILIVFCVLVLGVPFFRLLPPAVQQFLAREGVVTATGAPYVQKAIKDRSERMKK